MGPIGCPETSVRSYHHTLRNSPEECRSLSVFFIFSSKKMKIVLNGCETWGLSLKEVHGLRVAGRKREEVLGLGKGM